MVTKEDRPGWPYEYAEHALLVLNEVAQALHAVAKNRIDSDLTRVAKNLLDQYYFLPHYAHQMHDLFHHICTRSKEKPELVTMQIYTA